QVHIDHRLPVLDAHLVEDHVADDPRVVHHAIDAAEAVHGAGNDVLRAIPVGDAVGVDHRPATEAFDQFQGLLRRGGRTALTAQRHPPVVDHHRGAGSRHLHGDGSADAATGTGDHHYFVVEHVVLSVVRLQAEHRLGQDVALDLRAAAVDGRG